MGLHLVELVQMYSITNLKYQNSSIKGKLNIQLRFSTSKGYSFLSCNLIINIKFEIYYFAYRINSSSVGSIR